jgi:nucleoid-associated protein YgaU
MNKKLLLEKYIKVAVRKALQEQEEKEKRATQAMYLVYRFPKLKEVMIDLMSPAFGRFISDIEIVAPKPTTFSVKLINNEDFTIIYNGKGTYTAKVAGKRYNIQNLGELERASQGISDLLELNYSIDEKTSEIETNTPDAGAEAFNAVTGAPPAEIPGGAPAAPPAETPAGAEAPAAPEEEETPPAEA